MPKNRIKSLITLLEDDDPQTASQAMAELLSMGKINSVISSLQESSAPKMRMRVHQMQAVLKARKDRATFSGRLKDPDTDLLKGLTDLHIQWFDQDSPQEVYDSWGKFLSSTSEYQPDTLKKLGRMMKDFGYCTPNSEEFYPEYFCIGSVADECIGADFILCSIAKLAGDFHGAKTTTVFTPFGFGLCEPETGMMSFPSKDWMTCIVKNHVNFEVWNNSKILRLSASMIFFSSMMMQNFRYAYSAVSCLCEPGKEDISKILPYPLGDK